MENEEKYLKLSEVLKILNEMLNDVDGLEAVESDQYVDGFIDGVVLASSKLEKLGFVEKEDNKEPHKLTKSQEEQLWTDLYTLQDDNEKHCENAYFNNHVYSLTAEEIHRDNIESINWYLDHGTTIDEIYKYCPLAQIAMAY